MNDFNLQWVFERALARSCRPCYHDETPTLAGVRKWLDQVKGMKIRSIICLLSQAELDEYYGANQINLLEVYRQQSLAVAHIPIPDYQEPPVSSSDLKLIQKTLTALPRPWLIHCSAGIDRTGITIEFLRSKHKSWAR